MLLFQIECVLLVLSQLNENGRIKPLVVTNIYQVHSLSPLQEFIVTALGLRLKTEEQHAKYTTLRVRYFVRKATSVQSSTLDSPSAVLTFLYQFRFPKLDALKIQLCSHTLG